jgi:RNA polymerase sigma-70 factor (ECF subfamily)
MGDNEAIFKTITGFDFTNFYLEHKSKLTWHLSSMTKDLDEAEDFADDAFIQGLSKIGQYDPNKGAQIHTWIYTIGRNLVIKSWKDKQRIPSVSLDKEYDENSAISNFIPDDESKCVIEDIEIIKKALLCKKAIDELPEIYKEVLILREIEKMAYKDISDLLNVNLSTIKSRIRNGRIMVINKVQQDFKHIYKNGIDENDPIFEDILIYDSFIKNKEYSDEITCF